MPAPRLSAASLPTLSGITPPGYDRAALTPGILHIGVGGFHKAHQAVYTDDVLNARPGNWGIIGANLRSTTARDRLQPQDGLYTVATLDGERTERRVIGALQALIAASEPGEHQRLMSAIANPDIHVITLTVTEKGYCSHNGALDPDHPDVRRDLAGSQPQHSLPGLLAAGLEQRARTGGAPLTLISCDNLQGNGHVLKAVVSEYIDARFPGAAAWLRGNVAFPNTMVDRIVPQTTPTDRSTLVQEAGYDDAALVVCEPFRQWVIEDRFAGPRPAWELAGAELVADVSAFEVAKLRLLNGPHSACAYLGLLGGHRFVHEAMQEESLAEFVRELARRELQPMIAAPPGFDVSAYSSAVWQRFANAAVPYPTRQVASDGSQKLPQRLLPVVQARLQAGLPIAGLALVLAAWLEHLADPAPDPLAETLRGLHSAHREPAELVRAVQQQTPVFDLLNEQRDAVVAAVAPALQRLRDRGLRDTVADYVLDPK